jgi:3'-phosphoadenosine 5'-phosphosulfate sulfotransferase (PAPS reductase)/FAD synthetase
MREPYASLIGPGPFGNGRIEYGRSRWGLGPAGSDFFAKLGRAMDAARQALRMIRKPKPYVAFSGGKDSVCVAALVARVCPKAPLVWCDDELEYPETIELMRDYYRERGPQRFERLPGTGPHNDWFRPWQDQGFPWREPKGVAHVPAVHVWEQDLGYNVTFLGTRAKESSKRAAWLADRVGGPTYRVKGGRVRCCPIWDWSDDDAWTLIAGWGLRYNAAYDAFDRLNLPGHLWRVGPLPLVPRGVLAAGWPEMLGKLESIYGDRWDG